MATISEASANDVCVECLEHGVTRNAVTVITFGQIRVPLCKPHFDKLINDLAAEGLVG